MILYVDGNAARDGNGTKEMPYQSINDAAQAAMPGDEVLVGARGVPGIRQSQASRSGRRPDYLPQYQPLGAVITRGGRGKGLAALSGYGVGLPDCQFRVWNLQSLHHLCLRRLVLCRKDHAHRGGVPQR